MYKVGDIVYNKQGHAARIISVDADFKPNNQLKICNIIAIVTVPQSGGQTTSGLYYFTEDGCFAGVPNALYDLFSNEPNTEEAALIRQIGDICEGSVSNREEAMLKVIRQLRRK